MALSKMIKLVKGSKIKTFHTKKFFIYMHNNYSEDIIKEKLFIYINNRED